MTNDQGKHLKDSLKIKHMKGSFEGKTAKVINYPAASNESRGVSNAAVYKGKICTEVLSIIKTISY